MWLYHLDIQISLDGLRWSSVNDLVGLVGWASLSSDWCFIIKKNSLGFLSGQQEFQEGDHGSHSVSKHRLKAPKHHLRPDSRGREIDPSSWGGEQQSHIAKGRATGMRGLLWPFVTTWLRKYLTSAVGDGRAKGGEFLWHGRGVQRWRRAQRVSKCSL